MALYRIVLTDDVVEEVQVKEQKQSGDARFFRMSIIVGVLLCGFMLGTYMNVFANTNDEGFSDGNVVVALGTYESEAAQTVLVAPGDSLWSIAKSHAPKKVDVRYYVEQMIHLNELHDHIIYADQILRLP